MNLLYKSQGILYFKKNGKLCSIEEEPLPNVNWDHQMIVSLIDRGLSYSCATIP